MAKDLYPYTCNERSGWHHCNRDPEHTGKHACHCGVEWEADA